VLERVPRLAITSQLRARDEVVHLRRGVAQAERHRLSTQRALDIGEARGLRERLDRIGRRGLHHPMVRPRRERAEFEVRAARELAATRTS
jgi:hypothetical protein